MNQLHKSVFCIADSLLTCRDCFCFLFLFLFGGVCFVFVLKAVQNALTRVCGL